MLEITKALIQADKDEGVSTDALMALTGMTPSEVRDAMRALEQYGICSNDMELTAFVSIKVENSSIKNFKTKTYLK